MMVSFQHLSCIWPLLSGVVLSAIVGLYSWRHRKVPGAAGLAFVMLFSAVKLLAGAMELAAEGFQAKVFWYQVGDLSLFPITAAGLAFAFGYVGLDEWLSRRVFTPVSLPYLLYVPLSLTNPAHHLVWSGMTVNGQVHASPGPLAFALPAYGLLISAVTIAIFIGPLIRSRRHRWPVGLILLCMLTSRGLYVLDASGLSPFEPLDSLDVAASLIPLVYFIALFHFRLFDLVPVARSRVIDQMRDGMLVLDPRGRIADLNRAALELLGVKGPDIIGLPAAESLSSHPSLAARLVDPAAAQGEVWLDEARCLQVRASSLTGAHGFTMGRLILLSDITERKRAQRLIQEQQHIQSGLEERQRLARELHDGMGQCLAAAQLQAKTAREFLARNQPGGAEACLDQLAGVLQEGKRDVRDYLSGTKAWSSPLSFFSGLRRYLDGFSRDTGIHLQLDLPDRTETAPMGEAIGMQLQRIVQEALTNVRKHAGARSVRLIFGLGDGEVRLAIEDDGRGFDPAALEGNPGYGLAAMKGRAESLGGTFRLESSPNDGTRISVKIPLKKGAP